MREHTVLANRAGFHRWAFQPGPCATSPPPTCPSSCSGARLAAPLGLAPTGYTRMMHPSGEPAVAEASANRALPYCLSTVGTTSIEDLAATGHPRLWFQLYVLKDRGHTRSLVERAAAAGYEALEVSVDTAVPGHRVRDVRNGLTIPPQLSARTILDIGRTRGTGRACCAARCSASPTSAPGRRSGQDGGRTWRQVRPVGRLGRPGPLARLVERACC